MSKPTRRIVFTTAFVLFGIGLARSVHAIDGPTATFLPSLINGQSIAFELAPNEIAWFQFDAEALRAQNSFLDITTSFGDLGDTEIALYNDLGRLIASDDDDGIELRSTLSFGTGSGLELGDAFNLGNGSSGDDNDGRAVGDDGDLSPGRYYLAVGAYESRFGETNFAASSLSDLTGGSQLTFYTTAVPEPSGICFGLLLMGMGLWPLARSGACT